MQEAQDGVTELGTGGGFANSRAELAKGDFVPFGKSFIIPKADVPFLKECAEYFQGKCMQVASLPFHGGASDLRLPPRLAPTRMWATASGRVPSTAPST